MAVYNPKSMYADDFINHEEILETLEYAERNKNNLELIDSLLEKARPKKTAGGVHCAGLTHREASVLLACENPEKIAEMYRLAEEIKLAFYGNRIVMFAPLYLSNYCINGCVYCPYHAKNRHIARKKLTQDEVRAEVIALQDLGHKRLAIEAGEDPKNNPIEYILECLDTIYSVKHKNGAIRRANVNIAATTVDEYRMLKNAGIGTYILFQETYHKNSYLELHPTGPKHDYDYHTEAMDRAMEGGIDDVGLGVLFGLEKYRYEFAGLLMHAEHLEAVHGVGPHTISVPRIKRADDIDPDVFDNGLADPLFEKGYRVHPHCRSVYRHDHFHPRERKGARACTASRHFSDQRCVPHLGRRLHRAGASARHRAVRCFRPAFARRSRTVADGDGIYSFLLHSMLPRGTHGRPLHESVQVRSDPQLLPSERTDDA